MGVLYARVGGAWVPVIAPAPTPADEVWVGPNAPTASETELWVDADQTPAPMLYARIAGNWTSVSSPPTNEVAVQPDAPTGSEELWYDTDAPGYTNEDLRWMSAWGLIATETTALLPADGTTVTAGMVLCGANSVTLLAGRRYRFTVQIRAMEVTVAATSGSFTANLKKNGVDVTPQQQAWFQCQNNYESTCFSYIVTGDGSTANYTVVVGSLVGAALKVHLTNAPGDILCVEDVGPVVGAAPTTSPLIDRWNTAWGVVSMGSVNGPGTAAASVVTQVTSNIAVTPRLGRRYRVMFQMRASSASSATTAALNLWDGGAGSFAGSNIHGYVPPPSIFGALIGQWVFDGDNVVRSFNVRIANPSISIATYGDPPSYFYIEDVGPVSGAVPIADPTPAWTNVTFQNGWSNLGGGWQTVQYRKIGDIVYLRGMMTSGTGTVSGSAPAFTLPAGYRPPANTYLVGDSYSGGAASYHSTLWAQPTGEVSPEPGTGRNNWSLNQAYFSVNV